MVCNCTDVCDQHRTRKTRDNIHAQVRSEHVRVKWLNQHTAHLQRCLELSTILVLHMQSHSVCICMHRKRNQRTKLLPHGCHSEDTKYRQNSLDHREMGNRSAKADRRTGGEQRNQVATETEKTGDNYRVSHLYMRSMSISGSSWNSLIFTVSDKILLRFLRSSST